MEFFSEGVYFSLAAGAAYALLLLVFRHPILAWITPLGAIREYAGEYFDIILLFFFLTPIANLLDNMVIADGGEKLSTVANVAMILGNVALSFLLALHWGIKGVALASVASKLLYLLIICLHFFAKTSSLRLVPCCKARDAMLIFKSGIAKASTYALEAIAYFALNLFVLSFFDSDTMVLLVMGERLLGMLTMFIGLSMAAQPLIGILKGENNTKALWLLMWTVCFDLLAIATIVTLLVMLGAPLLVMAFGVTSEPLKTEGIITLRVIGTTLVFHAILLQFFVYFYMMDRGMGLFQKHVFLSE